MGNTELLLLVIEIWQSFEVLKSHLSSTVFSLQFPVFHSFTEYPNIDIKEPTMFVLIFRFLSHNTETRRDTGYFQGRIEVFWFIIQIFIGNLKS